MAREDQTSSGHPADSSDEAIWQYCRVTDAELDEAEQLLDLAGFVDSRLDPDEHDRVAALLMTDIAAAGDVAAARSLAARSHPDADEALVARASALVAGPTEERGRVILFHRLVRPPPSVFAIAQWGGLAAAIVMASWIGFALGSDASVGLSQINQSGDESFMGDLVDPSGGVLRSISDGLES
jgi:anti-sigma factor RsiW